jgi:predicted outer membrane protein
MNARNTVLPLLAAAAAVVATNQVTASNGEGEQPGTSPTASPTVTLSPSPTDTPSPSPTATPASSPTPTPTSTVAIADLASTEALNFIHHVNNLEIQENQEALSRLDGEAQEYAETVISDHRASERDVLQVATEENVSIFSFQAATYELAAANELRTLTGDEFDSAFLEHQAEEHERALATLQSMRGSVTDPEVLALIDQTIPVFQKHLDQARSLSSRS